MTTSARHQTSDTSPTGIRYRTHKELGSHVLLFVRRYKKTDIGGPQPRLLLGPADYVTHKGSRPMGITWRLRHQMPADVWTYSAIAANRPAASAARGRRLPGALMAARRPPGASPPLDQPRAAGARSALCGCHVRRKWWVSRCGRSVDTGATVRRRSGAPVGMPCGVRGRAAW
ncbi:DUF3427 domain-containing protein [Streptomyces marianii]|uniref:DUF3427 domain-containing protein n=1 Tax=Streptomyces marianii TaxID=1817406 RepID=A0A5R9EEJ4_9ACTN|nr:DUF3427 domain-containing protein [Streptomyces marianii]